MKLHVTDEFSQLKCAAVCWADHAPLYREYKTTDPEFTKFHPYSWDKGLMLKQQAEYFALLDKYGVELIFPKTDEQLTNQMFTRDTAFVVGETLYYGGNRKFGDRNGEILKLFDALSLDKGQTVSLGGKIEGGDLLVSGADSCLLGQTSRTDSTALGELEKQGIRVHAFQLGDHVMHLDTRLTILPNNIAVCYLKSFSQEDADDIRSTYQVIEVSDGEQKKLGTNVFAINPETIVVPLQHRRIGKELLDHGFQVELVDYTEPINFGGSFRCTTMPLVREN